MRVLVTGGAGFIGSHIVDRLLARGADVAVVDNLSSGKLANLTEARREGGVSFHRFDIRTDGVREMIEGAKPEVVVHMAAQPAVPDSMKDPVHDAQVNVVGLLRVLEACVHAGVRKVVFASSGGTIYGKQAKLPIRETARGRPVSPYGITKRVAEDYLRFYRDQHELDFMSLALANVYGPRQDPHGEAGVVAIFTQKMMAGEAPTIFGTGEITRDYVYVEDVAHAFVLACEQGSGQTVNIGTGTQTTVSDLFRTIADAAGFTDEVVHGPPRPGDLARSALDPSKAAEVLGWQPWTSVSEGVRQTVEWFAAQTR